MATATLEKKVKEKVDGAKELQDNEYAHYALRKIKESPQDALYAMSERYKALKMGEDPILAEAFARAASGLKAGSITDSGLVNAIIHYGQKYETALKNARVEDILSRLEAYNIPIKEPLRKALKQYAQMKFSDLEKRAKDKDKNDEKAIKAYNALIQLDDAKFRIIDGEIGKKQATELQKMFEEEEKKKEKAGSN
jgi:hypothetical protein